MSLRCTRSRLCTRIAAITLGALLVLPVSGSFADSYSVEDDGSLSFSRLNLQKLMADEADRAQTWDPPHFAVPNRVHLTPGTSGVKERLANGAVVWRLKMSCDNAKSFNLGTRFQIGDSVTISLLDADGKEQDRPYTSADNKPHGEFWSPIITGNTIEIEATMRPSDWADFMQNFAVISVNIGFRDIGSAAGLDRSGTCHNDIVCPEASGWEGEIESVGWYTLNGFGVCTGFMINNVNFDETPLFMTANHCGVTSGNDSSMRVYWNYEHSTCRDDSGTSNNGPPGNGSLSQSQTGATLLASSSNSDFCLVLLDAQPNASWGVTYAGWDSRDTASPSGAGVHHPNLDEKRISFYNTNTSNIDSGLVQVYWSDGVTEGGSSGSPLFDSNHRMIGQLCCGFSFCSQQNQPDQYGRFDVTFQNSTVRQYLCNGCSANSDAFIDTLIPGGGGDPTGSCCVGSSCSVTTQAGCSSSGGSWGGAGSSCLGNPCGGGDPTGSCCVGTSCSVATNADCTTAGGTWGGAGTTCSSSTCGGGECQEGYSPDCQGNCFEDLVYVNWTGDTFCDDGAYIPADYGYGGEAGQEIYLNCAAFACDGGDCVCEGDPTGACCDTSGNCQDGVTQADCTSAGGTYAGDGALCGVSTCGDPGEFETYVIDLAGANSWDVLNDADNESFSVDLGVGAEIAGVSWTGCVVTTVAPGSWASDTGFYFADSSLTEETSVIGFPFAGQEGTSTEADLTAYLADSGIANIPSADGVFYVEIFEYSDDQVNYDESPNAVDNIIDTGTLTIIYVPGEPQGPVCGNGVVEDGEECDDGNNTPDDGCTNCTLDPEPCTGDFDGDGAVGLNDFSAFLVVFGSSCSGCPEDITGDGQVNTADFAEFLVVFGNSCP